MTSEVPELPVTIADVGPDSGPTVLLHGHVDVVPGHAEQFEPRIEGDKTTSLGSTKQPPSPCSVGNPAADHLLGRKEAATAHPQILALSGPHSAGRMLEPAE